MSLAQTYFLSKHLQTASHTLHGINQPQFLAAHSYFGEVVGLGAPEVKQHAAELFLLSSLRIMPLHPFLHLKQDP